MHHESRLSNIIEYVSRLFQYRNTEYPEENLNFQSKLRLVGPAAFTEKCLDTFAINWYIQTTDVYFPKLKRIFVDDRDQDLFQQIDKSEGKRVVVVCN